MIRLAVPIALIVLAVGATAAHAGPPLLGGEEKVVYLGSPKGGGEAKVELDAGTDTISYLWLRAARVTRCANGGKRVWREEVGLVNRPFHIGRGLHTVKRERSLGLTTWDLRFDPTWSKVTLTYSTRFRHNYLGLCSGSTRIVLTHRPPAKTWLLGAYAGTTTQGLPLSLTAASHSTRAGAWTYTDFVVRNLAATVAFACSDGFTATMALTAEDGDQRVFGGALSATLTRGGVARNTLSGPEQIYAELDAKLSGGQVTGTIRPEGAYGETGSCAGNPIAFSASRAG